MERLAANAMASLSFTMLIVGLAAGLALILGAVGLYGVLSYRVTRSAREIGVRMALGAQAKSVRWMFVRQGGQVALLGVVVGALAAVGLTRYIQTLLFGVQRLDVATFAGMSAVMLAVALLATSRRGAPRAWILWSHCGRNSPAAARSTRRLFPPSDRATVEDREGRRQRRQGQTRLQRVCSPRSDCTARSFATGQPILRRNGNGQEEQKTRVHPSTPPRTPRSRPRRSF